MSINLKVLIVFAAIWTAAAIREHVVKSHDPKPASVTAPAIVIDSVSHADSTGR